MIFRPWFLTYVDILHFAAAAAAWNCSEDDHRNAYKMWKPCEGIIWRDILAHMVTFSVQAHRQMLQAAGVLVSFLDFWSYLYL